jgi:hypothetical protein
VTEITGKYQNVTIETIDRAVRDWFDRTVDARVRDPSGELTKVPVQFSQGERWAARAAFRDENGVLILPILALRRTGIDPDPTRMALGCQTEYIQVAKLVDPKTNDIQNLESGKKVADRRDYPPVFDVYTIPFPDRVMANYQLVIQAQYISQMNEILQKIWRSLDIQKSFVAPFENDGRRPPRVNQYGFADPYQPPPPLNSPYVVGFLESTSTDAGNFEEFTDSERIVKYTTEVKVPCAIQTSPEGEPPALKVQRTAYKLVMKDEVVRTVDQLSDLDAIFGTLK